MASFFGTITNLFASINPFDTRISTPASRLFARAAPSTLVLLIGLDESGKSTLLREYLSPRPESVHTLITERHIILEELQAGPTTFQAYDIGGCRPDFFWWFEEGLFKRADAVIYLVDAADRDRIMEAREELIMHGLQANNGGMRRGVPLLVLVTKTELENARRPDQIETYFIDNIITSIGDRPTKVAGVNLTTGKGVLDALSWISNTLLNGPQSIVESEKAALTEKSEILRDSRRIT
ncbi:P-loop containing nucleoside triphosphate hydrolase protein [Paraphaeosphaeria sporulosa]|uniref:p-loop containing nucleoside triphosphate hydrolase protein n=1 Tax=Paraphaeosphaeria sporulosa TaxID=1460663 RepID=A0A177CPK6_9PLEO|nr:P-loop containing nucleoside triphosphate hydrolase protein [Paraphaeosphaeria sporulosa]OAG09455.1 P-loop containing nucleoside triphosphate hydrolase protein [Paraphaeosphaeria sporulosa]